MTEEKRKSAFFLAALASYLLAYAYTSMNLQWFGAWYILFTECFAWLLGIKPTKESLFWLSMVALQVAAAALWKMQDPVLGEGLQGGMLHLSAVYYVLCRGNMLIAGETSGFLLLDMAAGLLIVPFRNFLLRLRTLASDHPSKAKGWGAALGLVVILAFGLAAWHELAGASTLFQNAWSALLRSLGGFFCTDTLLRIFWSLPVGMYLYGLIAGSFLEQKSPLSDLKEKADSWKRISPLFFLSLMGVLIAIYAVFFLTSTREFVQASGGHLSAVDASRYAVDGFWNLIRIVLLNELALALKEAYGKEEEGRAGKIFCCVLLCMSLAFAALDGAKLAAYIALYGWTLKRYYAVWALGYVTFVTVLSLAYEKKKFPAVKAAAYAGIVIFTALCLMNASAWPAFAVQ